MTICRSVPLMAFLFSLLIFPILATSSTFISLPTITYIHQATGGALAVIRANKDASLYTVGADVNHGGEDHLSVSFQKPPPLYVIVEARSIVGFDIYNDVPPGSEVTKAILTLTVKEPPSNSLDVQVYALTKSFYENTVTWFSHANSYSSLLATKSISFDAHEGTKVRFDVTAYVRSKVLSGSPIYGFLLKCPSNEHGSVKFFSREGAPYSSWKPTLVLSYRTSYIDMVADQTSLDVKQGDKAYVQLSVGGTFNGNAEITHSWEGAAPTGITLHLSKTSGKVPFASTLEIDVSSSTPPGDYELKLKAKNSQGSYNLYKEQKIEIHVLSAVEPDFMFSVYPSSLSVIQGQVAEYSVTLTPIAGFSSQVHLSVSDVPPGSAYQFVSSGSNLYLRVATSPATPPGEYSLVVTAQGGGKAHTASITLIVAQATATTATTQATTQATETAQASFLMTVNPDQVRLTRGGSACITVTVQGKGGFSSPVTFSASGLPRGITISSSVNNALPDFTANLTLVATNSAPLGTHQFTLIATGGGVTKSSTVTVIVAQANEISTTRTGQMLAPDFSLSIKPEKILLNPSSTGSVAVTVKWIKGSGTVQLSASGLPSDAKVRFNPQNLSEGTSSLVIQAGRTTGTFTVVVTGRSGSLSKSATFQLQIKAEESRCIIATAAFGSELAPEVSYLRSFRDNMVMSTYSGSRFLTVFSSFYYSWSPGVAAMIRGSPVLSGITRAMIIPLLAVLKAGGIVYELLPGGESSMMAVGSLVSFLLGLVYLWPLSLLLRKVAWLRNRKLILCIASIAVISAISLGVSTIFMIDPLAMFSSSSLVVSLISLPPLLLAKLLTKGS